RSAKLDTGGSPARHASIAALPFTADSPMGYNAPSLVNNAATAFQFFADRFVVKASLSPPMALISADDSDGDCACDGTAATTLMTMAAMAALVLKVMTSYSPPLRSRRKVAGRLASYDISGTRSRQRVGCIVHPCTAAGRPGRDRGQPLG